jgi:hypothetical protein
MVVTLCLKTTTGEITKQRVVIPRTTGPINWESLVGA